MISFLSGKGRNKRAQVQRRRAMRRRTNAIKNLFSNKLMHQMSYTDWRNKVRSKYGGPQGAFLSTASMLSLHLPLGERLLREHKFDLRGAKRILDVGSGAGQIAQNLLKYADTDAEITCFDLSPEMLGRARVRMKSDRPMFVVTDLTHLPFEDESFDCVTCGYVLEHVPDTEAGLAELSRVMVPGGRMLLLATEDSLAGGWTSHLWCCQTYNRRELRQMCHRLGLVWKQELWFTRLHKILKFGGICVEIEKKV